MGSRFSSRKPTTGKGSLMIVGTQRVMIRTRRLGELPEALRPLSAFSPDASAADGERVYYVVAQPRQGCGFRAIHERICRLLAGVFLVGHLTRVHDDVFPDDEVYEFRPPNLVPVKWAMDGAEMIPSFIPGDDRLYRGEASRGWIPLY